MIIFHRQPSDALTCGKAIVDNIQHHLKQAHESVVKCIAIENVKESRDCFSRIASGVGETLKLSKDQACADEDLSSYRTDADEWANFESYEQTAIVEMFAGEALIEPTSKPIETEFPLFKENPLDVLLFPNMLKLVERSIDHIYNKNCQRDVIRVKYDIVGAYYETSLCRNRQNHKTREAQTACRERVAPELKKRFEALKHLKECTEAISPNAQRVHSEYGKLLDSAQLLQYLAGYVNTSIKHELFSPIYRLFAD